MSSNTKQPNKDLTSRPPIAVVMGHIDHGKTTLLDAIREENVVGQESGGITQHVGAYEAKVKTKDGKEENITFVDTPGHEAFSKIRSRGADAADIAILVVAADDGVKKQTEEALSAINEAGIPFIVAINKIDKPNANIEKVMGELSERDVLVESWGGKIPSVEISAKNKQGLDELLEMILLVAHLEDIKSDPNGPAFGVVVEAHCDPKRGNAATLIISGGTLRTGDFIVSGSMFSPVRIFENFAGKPIKEAGPGQPVLVVGFSGLPEAGGKFKTALSKKEAEDLTEGDVKKEADKPSIDAKTEDLDGVSVPEIPVVVKADTQGSLEALEGELDKIKGGEFKIKKLRMGVGAINEDDIKLASGNESLLIVGFKVGIDKGAEHVADRFGVTVKTFDIIYEIPVWFKEEVANRLPVKVVEHITGKAKILQTFSKDKEKQIIGGRVSEGSVSQGAQFRIVRRDNIIGKGKINELQHNKIKISSVEEGNEFGMAVVSKISISKGDVLEIFKEEEIKPEI